MSLTTNEKSLIDTAAIKHLGLLFTFKEEDDDPLSLPGMIRQEEDSIDNIANEFDDELKQAIEDASDYILSSDFEDEEAFIVGLLALFSFLNTMSQRVSDVISEDMIAVLERTREAMSGLIGIDYTPAGDEIVSNIRLVSEAQSLFVSEHVQGILNKVREDIQLLISEAKADGVISLIEKQSLVDSVTAVTQNFVDKQVLSFDRTFSSSSLTRARTYSTITLFREVGIETMIYDNPLDEKTTDFCRSIAGKEVQVSAAIESFEKIMTATTVDELKDVAPFITSSENNGNIVYTLNRGSLENISFSPSESTIEFLTDHNILTPPFHYLCRTLLVPLSTFGSKVIVSITGTNKTKKRRARGFTSRLSRSFSRIFSGK